MSHAEAHQSRQRQVYSPHRRKQAPSKGKSRCWECVCSCDGKTVVVRGNGLLAGTTTSCGCIRRELGKKRTIDYTGEVFGRWTVLHPVPCREDQNSRWMCVCSCKDQTKKDLAIGSLVGGKSLSCGCLKRELAEGQNRTHGMSESPEFGVWLGIIQRCYNKNNKAYKAYGGRGIIVCERWKGSFVNFFSDMGIRPSDKHEIDRFPNNNGNYEPGNCRWATHKQNMRNTRSNRKIEYQGESHTAGEWSGIMGINERTIKGRLRAGWNAEKALTTPVKKILKIYK